MNTTFWQSFKTFYRQGSSCFNNSSAFSFSLESCAQTQPKRSCCEWVVNRRPHTLFFHLESISCFPILAVDAASSTTADECKHNCEEVHSTHSAEFFFAFYTKIICVCVCVFGFSNPWERSSSIFGLFVIF